MPASGASHELLPTTLALRDGRRVTVREIRPDDKQAMRAAFDRLSPDARYTRFMAARRSLSDQALESATHPSSREQLITEVALGIQAEVQQERNPLDGYRPTSEGTAPAGDQVLVELSAVFFTQHADIPRDLLLHVIDVHGNKSVVEVLAILHLVEDLVQIGDVVAKLVSERKLGGAGAQALHQTPIRIQTVVRAAE